MGACSSIIAIATAARIRDKIDKIASKARLAKELASWAFGRRRLFRVRGSSMTPTLEDGDWVLIKPLHGLVDIPIGAVVVVDFPAGGIVIKRVRSRGEGTIALGSDNPSEATDSRELGSVAVSAIIGIVTEQFKGEIP